MNGLYLPMNGLIDQVKQDQLFAIDNFCLPCPLSIYFLGMACFPQPLSAMIH